MRPSRSISLQPPKRRDAQSELLSNLSVSGSVNSCRVPKLHHHNNVKVAQSRIVVSNDGYLPLHAVSANFMLAEIGLNGPPTEGGTPVAIRIETRRQKERTFNREDKTVIPFSDCFIMPPTSLCHPRPGFEVTFLPIRSSSRKTRIVMYTARSIALGRFYWDVMPCQ
jgi:hypothetical protein